MIRILFTRNNSVMSQMIRYLTGEEVSHCAVEVKGYVIHSNLLGIRCEAYSDFIKKSKVELSVAVPKPNNLAGVVLSKLVTTSWKFYDFGALLYLGVCLIGVKFFGLKMPKKNIWKSTGMFLCTELVTDMLEGREESMITPYQLYLKLSQEKEENSNGLWMEC